VTRDEFHAKQRDYARRQNGKRDTAILKRRADGWTLERIGLRYGLTKERVRQILARIEKERKG
jgi:DNA-directed RNA polymerase sigma subunit (sigma70/sigma32)